MFPNSAARIFRWKAEFDRILRPLEVQVYEIDAELNMSYKNLYKK